MGEGWGEVGQHLPALYRIVKRLTKDEPRNMGIVRFTCFTSSGFDLPCLSSDLLFASVRSELPWTSAHFNARVMAGAIRGWIEGDKYKISHGITLEPLFMVCSWSLSVMVCCFVGQVMLWKS